MNPTSTDREPAPASDGELFGRLLKQLAEAFEYASHYLVAKADEAKSSARSAMLRAQMVIVGVLTVAGLIVAGVTLLFIGLAGGLGEAFGKPWLGQLVSGLILILVVALAIWGRTVWLRNYFLKRTQERYEQRHRQTRNDRTVVAAAKN